MSKTEQAITLKLKEIAQNMEARARKRRLEKLEADDRLTAIIDAGN
jgi:hypothetical protein